MPIYEYQCARCGEVFEVIQKFSDRPLSRCKFCGGKVERLISNSSFQLKGSGWYLSDYARKPEGSSPEKTENKVEKSKESSSPAEAKADKSEKSSSTKE